LWKSTQENQTHYKAAIGAGQSLALLPVGLSGQCLFAAVCVAALLYALVSPQELDKIRESEISIINRLAAEREDNVMWREFRTRLLRNMGLVSADTELQGSMQLSWDGVIKPTSTTIMTLAGLDAALAWQVAWLHRAVCQGGVLYQEHHLHYVLRRALGAVCMLSKWQSKCEGLPRSLM
jgi:hypothetical protein